MFGPCASLPSSAMLRLLPVAVLCVMLPGVSAVREDCPAPTPTVSNGSFSQVYPVLDKNQAALLLLLGFGGFSVLLAFFYAGIRKHVFHDANSLDTAFDAGGNVSTSLTAVTVASQLLWPGNLLQSATVAIKNGIAGAFWYTTCAVINMILFPVLSVKFKTRAPGAKTFLQVIHARFGTFAHLVFCLFALLMNLVVTTCLLTASTALLQALVKDASPEFCVLIMATLFGSYSFVGGLGCTFYVSYFNAAIIYIFSVIFTIKIFYSGENFGTFDAIDFIYEKVTCLEGPPTNEEGSFVTFWSEGSMIWAVQGFFATASITFCDQASWQSRIAAKPIQGVVGFLSATYVWFAIPSTIGTTMGLGYLAMSANDTVPLSNADVDAGLVTVFMAQKMLGVAGSYMVLTMVTMAVMSTGSGEVMAISSIIVYDIYQTHVKPFKKVGHTALCLLCGEVKPRDEMPNGEHNGGGAAVNCCKCPLASECECCQNDLEALKETDKTNTQRIYRCPHHGDYRSYLDSLVVFKSWCILWVTIALIPIGLLVISTGVDLNYVTLCGFIMTTPSYAPALMTIIWTKTTAKGVIVGSLAGLASGIIADLSVASTFEGGLGNFLMNTSHNYSVLAGSSAAFGVSLILTFVISFFTHKIHNENDELKEWQKVRDIDNPLKPWNEIYESDFPDLPKGKKPTYKELNKVFGTANKAAVVGGVVSLILFVFIIPGSIASMHVLDMDQFRTWVVVLQVWCFLMTIVVIFVAPVEEIRAIFKRVRLNFRNKKIRDRSEQSDKADGDKCQGEKISLKSVEKFVSNGDDKHKFQSQGSLPVP